MREVYGNLAFCVCSLVLRAHLVVVVSSYDSPYAKFASNAETKATDDGSRPKVS